jgi:hypothetical protein
MSPFEASLTEVYVLVDDLVAADPPPPRPGPAPRLAAGEVVTLALISQLHRFTSGRDFYRFAETQLRGCFPQLPHRTQFWRQMHRHAALIARVAVTLGAHLAGVTAFEILDCTAMPTRNHKRRGRGWMPGEMTIGFSNRLGIYHGAKVLTCSAPSGVLTGFGLAPAHCNDRPLAEELVARRRWPDPVLPSAGPPGPGVYLADQGFGGRAIEHRFAERYQATLLCPPQPDRQSRRWPKPLRRWLIHHRQAIEAVHHNLMTAGRLTHTRPHSVVGALTDLAATAALHNVRIWLNRRHGRPDLAYAEVFGW